MTLTIKGATTIKASTTVGFQPGSLFAAGEQGVWYDPSDMTTMFQDVAGTTPVTAMEQSVGLLLDKRSPAYSVYFDGTGDYISTSSANFAFGTGDFTIEALVYTSDVSATTQKGWFQTSSNAGGLYNSYTSGVAIYYGNGGAGRASINVGGTEYTSSTSVISTNTWYHIAVTRSSGTVRLFVNGVLVASGSGNTSNLTGQNASIGGYYDSNFLLPGYISNLRVISGISLYTAAFTPPTKPLTPVSGTSLLTCGTSWSGNPAFTINGNCVAKNLNPFGAGIGNHATQSTAANRPVLSARVNYIRNSATPWLQTSSGYTGLTFTNQGTYGPDGVTPVYKSVINSSGSVSYCYSNPDTGLTLSANTIYKISQRVKTTPNDYQYVLLKVALASGTRYCVLFNASTGAFVREYSVGTINNNSYSATSLGDGWWEFSIQASNPSPTAAEWGLLPIPTSNPTLNGDFDLTNRGDDVKGIYLGGSDIRVANQGVNLPSYQRVNTATDYDTTNFPYYLRFDGTNDFLQVSSFALPLINRMTMVSMAGYSATSYAGIVSVYPTSGNDYDNINGYVIQAGESFSSGLESTGSISSYYNVKWTTSPNTPIQTSVITEDKTAGAGYLRINGTQVSSDTNFTEFSSISTGGLLIGARWTGSISAGYRLNGRIYGVIIRGTRSFTQQIQATEFWLNQKTKAY